MNCGVIHDEPFSAYCSTECVGSHRLEELMPFPIRYYLRYIEKSIPEPEPTDEFKFGRALHALALEGQDAFAARYTLVPADAPREPTARQWNAKKPSPESVAAMKWWKDFYNACEGREVITEENHEMCWRMMKSVRAKPVVAELFDHGKPEVTFRHQLASYGIQSRIDWFNPEAQSGPLIVDLKSIESLEMFDYQYHKYSYYRQAAFYRLVVSKVLGVPSSQIQFTFAVCEKREPYLCARRDPDAQSLEKGEEEVLNDLKLLKHCYDIGVWPGSPEYAVPVSLPERFFREL